MLEQMKIFDFIIIGYYGCLKIVLDLRFNDYYLIILTYEVFLYFYLILDLFSLHNLIILNQIILNFI